MGRDARLKRERHSRRDQPRAPWLSRRTRHQVGVGLGVALVVAAVGAGYTWWSGHSGEVAPAFALPASTGETVRLEDYRGKQPVLLVFYMVGT